MEQLIREAEHTINPPWWWLVVGGIQSDDCCASSKVKGSNFGKSQHKSVRTKLPNCTGAHGCGRICNPEVISTCLRFLSCKVPIAVCAVENVNCCKTESKRPMWETPSCEWSEWSVKDTPGIGACLLEEWANELRRDWF